ncbi:hypothetical protein UVI_02049550 [Ustilaginoidea virens]|nr:hypothetical protein UVI_02049550 [Ustilaginoidea virens]
MAACLVNKVSARGSYVPEKPILRAKDVLERPYSDILHHSWTAAEPALGARAVVLNTSDRRADGVKVNENGTLDYAAWDAATDAACTEVLMALPRSSSPSGSCACYNLPLLDTKTGWFEAELRLYRISEPRAAFADISLENVKVGLRYAGASVSSISTQQLVAVGRAHNQARVMAPRAVRDARPQLVHSYLLAGKIDKAKMSDNMTMAQLEKVLIPTLALTANNSAGTLVSTNLSLNEAAFLTGIFSRSVVVSDFSAAESAVAAQLDALRTGTVAFVLPGVQVMIFPIGAVITSVWLLVGLAVYGLGTYERMAYADMYKRRLAAEAARRTA